MPTYEVTHEDGRKTVVNSDQEQHVKKQANHAEITRRVIAEKRNHPAGPDPALAVSYVKIKD